MADSTSVRSNLAGLMQDHLSSKVVSLVCNIMPLVAMIIRKDGRKRGNIDMAGKETGIYGLGRPGTGAFLSGVPTSQVRREQMINSDKYMPIIETSLPVATNGKVMGQRDTLPTVASADTLTPQSRFKRPFFKWTEIVDPVKVYRKDIRRTKSAAPNEQYANVAVGDLFRAQVDATLTTHLQRWNQKFWGTDQTIGTVPSSQAPSDQDAEVYDNIPSIANALSASTLYGGLDRSLAANAFYRGNTVTAHKAPVLSDLVNYANYQLGCAKKGVGINLLLTGATNFPIFCDEARQKGGQVMYDGLPDLAQYGVKNPVARFNNTFVMFDPECPDVLHDSGAYTKNVVLGVNLDTFTLIVSDDANFKIDETFNQSQVDGGDDAITTNIRTELILACEAPSMNVWFEDVG